MKDKIIYTENYALIVSDEQAKENDWGYIPFQGGEVKLVGKYFADDWKKVIAHRPLKDAPILEGVPLLPEFTQEEDVKLIAKQEAEKLHDKSKHEDWDIYDELISEDAWLIEKGYNKAKETYKYTEEDIQKAFIAGEERIINKSDSSELDDFTNFIQSLQPKRPKYFEMEVYSYDNPEYNTYPKTKLISQCQTELVGEYSYE